MSYEITFNKIKNGNIFVEKFECLNENGNEKIVFKKQANSQGGIAVVYAPNGTGKSSLSHVLEQEVTSGEVFFEAKYADNIIVPESKAFHVIGDQLRRNVIKGDTSDYLIGADIRREYELKKRIADGFMSAFSQKLPKHIKDEYKISKVSDFLLMQMREEDIKAYNFLRDIVSTKSRGKGIDREEYIQYILDAANRRSVSTMDEEKRRFFITDSVGSKIIEQLLALDIDKIVANAEIILIERDDAAINILNKYGELHNCIVCDNTEFNGEQLLLKKQENRKRIYDSLDKNTKEIFDKIVNDSSLVGFDPFEIKRIITDFISGGETKEVYELIDGCKDYIRNIVFEIINVLIDVFSGTSMLSDFKEYQTLLESQPQIDSEELLFIKEVIGENIRADITIERDEENDKNFKLMLAGKPFLNVERDQLHLSTGEQNFISLAFELLLARHSTKEFVVLDDPISSFDSIYKNKIAYCIIKFLENKKQMVFTHNIDLIRLLEVQQNGCFNLYMFNNSENGVSGFIPVKDEERKILINLYELVKLFQNNNDQLTKAIHNEKQFLMAMIPFMRGYAHISKEGNSIYENLSDLMHGYGTSTQDISVVYEELFGYKFKQQNISVNDILSLNCTSIDILDKGKYPLLNETLKQTLVYYHLRMKVEKKLVDIFHVQIRPAKPLMLNQLIQKTLGQAGGDTKEEAERKRNYRVFFASRKTLMNEFNHFEGNMNIFQPAIDIEASALREEINAIEAKLVELQNDYAG